MQGTYAILSSMACPDLQHSYTLSHKRRDFRGGGGGCAGKKKLFFFSSIKLFKIFFFL